MKKSCGSNDPEWNGFKKEIRIQDIFMPKLQSEEERIVQKDSNLIQGSGKKVSK